MGGAKYCPSTCEFIANQGKEEAARQKAAREKEEREKAAREKAAREKAVREKAAREKAAKRPCWLRLPKGCPRIGKNSKWFVDRFGGANSSTCERRRGLYARYCKTKTESCYARTTVGC